MYLNHTNTGPNIYKKIWKQIILVNLHKLLLAFHVSKSFMTDCLFETPLRKTEVSTKVLQTVESICDHLDYRNLEGFVF